MDNGDPVTAVGSWFNHHMDLPTGEQLDAGISSLRSWWELTDGEWLDEQNAAHANGAMVGETLAKKMDLHAGDTLHVSGTAADATFVVVGVYSSGDEADNEIYAGLDSVQMLDALDGKIDSIEVSALTTPDNDLAKKAAKDPSSLTISQYETWYCTAYVSSICYQIQEVVTDSVASAVRQVAQSEGTILDKTQLLMILIMALSLVGSALGINSTVETLSAKLVKRVTASETTVLSKLQALVLLVTVIVLALTMICVATTMTAVVSERRSEIGLRKAIGASDASIIGEFMGEGVLLGCAGGIVGALLGFGFAQFVSVNVFSSYISFRPLLIPITIVVSVAVTGLACLLPVRSATQIDPALVLKGE